MIPRIDNTASDMPATLVNETDEAAPVIPCLLSFWRSLLDAGGFPNIDGELALRL